MTLSDFFYQNGWCQNAEALNEKEMPCYPTSPEAAKFCIAGAYRKVTGCGITPNCYLNIAARQEGFQDVVYLNDSPGTTKEKVIKFLEKYNI